VLEEESQILLIMNSLLGLSFYKSSILLPYLRLARK
jgi:hypothetical protein